MACAIDATVGGVASNSYATILEADAYVETRMAGGEASNDAWDDASPDEKCRALQTATRLLDRWVEWDGTATSYQQKLAWPRWGLLKITGDVVQNDTIPDEIVWATTELAIVLLGENVTDQPDHIKSGLKGLKAGAVEIQFASATGGGLSTGERILPPSVFGLISQWVVSRQGGGSFARLVRV